MRSCSIAVFVCCLVQSWWSLGVAGAIDLFVFITSARRSNTVHIRRYASIDAMHDRVVIDESYKKYVVRMYAEYSTRLKNFIEVLTEVR